MPNKMIIGMVVLCFLILLAGCKKAAEETGETYVIGDNLVQDEIALRTAPVLKGTYENVVSFQGTVIYTNSVSLSFMEENAVFYQYLVEQGDFVREGDPLAECKISVSDMEKEEWILEKTMYQKELDSLTKQYENDIKKLDQLITQGTEEEKELYQLLKKEARSQYQQSHTSITEQIEYLEKKIELWNNTKNTNTIYAPMNGSIDKLAYMKEGDEIEDGRWIVMMHSEEERYIQVTDEKEQLYYNMTVTVEAGKAGQKQEYEGVVIQSDQVLSEPLKQNTALVVLKDHSVKPETLENILVKASIHKVEQTLMVNRSGVYSEKGKSYVLLLEDGAVKKRYITAGLSNSEYVCILDGAAEGWEIVLQ